jgi:hypothetical protein
MLDLARDREWTVSMHRGALQVLPTGSERPPATATAT